MEDRGDVTTHFVQIAEQTPLNGLRIGQLALEAGIPAGVLNVIPGAALQQLLHCCPAVLAPPHCKASQCCAFADYVSMVWKQRVPPLLPHLHTSLPPAGLGAKAGAALSAHPGVDKVGLYPPWSGQHFHQSYKRSTTDTFI